MQRPENGGDSYLIVLRQRRYRLAARVSFGNLSSLACIQCRPAPELSPLRLGALDAFLAALAN